MPDDIKLDPEAAAAVEATVVSDKIQLALLEELGLDLDPNLTTKDTENAHVKAAVATIKDSLARLTFLKGIGGTLRYVLTLNGEVIDKQSYDDANAAIIAAIQLCLTAPDSIRVLDVASGNEIFLAPPGGFNR